MLLNSWQKKNLFFFLLSIFTGSLIATEEKQSLSLTAAFYTTQLEDLSVTCWVHSVSLQQLHTWLPPQYTHAHTYMHSGTHWRKKQAVALAD